KKLNDKEEKNVKDKIKDNSSKITKDISKDDKKLNDKEEKNVKDKIKDNSSKITKDISKDDKKSNDKEEKTLKIRLKMILKNKDKNDAKDDQSKKRLGNNRNDKNSTSNINKQNNSSSSITSKSVSNSTNSQKVENPKKAIESIVFIGNKDKELNNISNQKGETSVNDLLYVLKNMPGKVNINKEGKEVYIEGDSYTPKEKDLKGNEYKFHGILRAKSDTNKQ
ncbi:hypothetical protein NAPIS_ORF00011, partial [Vairimorpha apis BRL 01]